MVKGTESQIELTSIPRDAAGLDLDYYRQRIPPDQLQVLMRLVGIYPASESFDPTKISYPEDL